MKVKISVLSAMLFCLMAAEAQVQVSNEPRHKNVLENKYIRLLNVWIQPGDTSLFHIHSTPSVFLVFTETNTVSQIRGGEWEKARYAAGHSWYRSFFHDTLIHRVGNCDTVPFHVTDVELLSPFDANAWKTPLAIPVLYENDKVVAYELTGGNFKMARIHGRGPIVAGLVAGKKVFYVDAETGGRKEITTGGYLYIEPGSKFYFDFKGRGILKMVLFEIK